MTATTAAPDQLRSVPLSAITVRDGFNPRGAFDEAAIERMAETMRTSGVLQPLLVHLVESDGVYELVDGERRYRAACRAGLTEIPVLIRARAQEAGALVSALTANFHRADHTPVEEARAFARLLEAGLTRKGICERLQVSRELVRDRLQILALPEELHAHVDAGLIPLGAVKVLAGLTKIHPGLPACALRRVLDEPEDSWRRRVSWNDVVADPVGAVTTQYGDEQPQLPEGVFEAFAQYPLSVFNLGEKGEKDLAVLATLNPAYASRDEVTVAFDGEMVERAVALGAAHRSEHGHSAVIVGQEVADELIAELVTAQLTAERARAETRRGEAGAAGGAAAPAAESKEQEEARRRQEREAERERRAHACSFNRELGVAVLKAFAKVRVDARVIQILSAIDFKNDLDDIAARGARYGFPGWPTENASGRGKAKTTYLERFEAAAKAREFLAGATSAAEIAGRCLALVAMAVLADEECVARSYRSMVSLHDYRPSSYSVPGTSENGLPWRRHVVELVEDLAIERLPEHLTARVREERERVRAEQEERAAQERAAEQADREMRGRLAEITPDERLEALREFGAEHGRHTERTHNLRQHIVTLNASQPETAGEPAATTATEDPGSHPAPATADATDSNQA
jgi:ParB/RepB/Spo0J family partition protein